LAIFDKNICDIYHNIRESLIGDQSSY